MNKIRQLDTCFWLNFLPFTWFVSRCMVAVAKKGDLQFSCFFLIKKPIVELYLTFNDQLIFAITCSLLNLTQYQYFLYFLAIL